MFWITQKRIYRSDLKNNPKVLYIFGDNLERVGLGGQAAEMRGEANAFGIATKRAPTYEKEDFFSDDDATLRIIIEEFDNLRKEIATGKYKGVVFPEDGIGTGISQLPEKAPLCMALVNELVRQAEEDVNNAHQSA